jgi:hypothetical protein
VTDSKSSLADSRIVPTLTKAYRPFWTGGAQGQLLILRCGPCGRWVHPPSKACPACGSTELTPQPTSGRATVFSYTVNRHPYNPAVPLPYVIAIVELVEQDDLRLMTNIVNCDPEAVSIGMPVRVLFEQHDEVYVPLFEPDPTP